MSFDNFCYTLLIPWYSMVLFFDTARQFLRSAEAELLAGFVLSNMPRRRGTTLVSWMCRWTMMKSYLAWYVFGWAEEPLWCEHVWNEWPIRVLEPCEALRQYGHPLRIVAYEVSAAAWVALEVLARRAGYTPWHIFHGFLMVSVLHLKNHYESRSFIFPIKIVDLFQENLRQKRCEVSTSRPEWDSTCE